MSAKITSGQLIQDFKDAISSTVGGEYVAEIDIHENSIISEDIQLDSVEVTRVFSFILNKYDKAPVVEWLSAKSIEEILQIRITDLRDFINQYYE